MGWGLGLAARRRGDLRLALDCYRDAVDSFIRAQERNNRAAVDSLQAESATLARNAPLAWRLRTAALSVLAGSGSPLLFHNLLWDSGVASIDSARWAGLDFLDEDVALATFTQDPVIRAEAFLRRAQILHALKRDEAAEADLDSSALAATDLPTAAMREKATVQIRRRRAEVLVSTAPKRAAEELRTVRDFYERHGLVVAVADIEVSRAQALVAADELRDAEAALYAAFRFMGVEATDLVTADEHVVLERAQRVLEELVLENVASGNVGSALVLAERGRGLLLDGDADPLDLARLQAGIPSGVAVVTYLVTDSRLVVWAITTSELRCTLVDVPRLKLQREIEKWQTIVHADKNTQATASKALGVLLLDPLRSTLAVVSTVIILPDAELGGLPFGALIDSATGEPLFVKHRVVFVSRLATLCAASRNRKNEGGRILLVADSRPSPKLGLPPLPSARREALRLAAEYPAASVLLGEEATIPAVLAGLADARVAQLAVHTRVDPVAPRDSAFFLTPSIGLDGALSPYHLAASLRSAPELVILPSCESSRESVRRAQRFATLATPFIEAGTEIVIGNIWPVDDSSSGEVPVLLSSWLARDRSVVDALWQAQQQAYERGGPAVLVASVQARIRSYSAFAIQGGVE